MQSLSDHLHAQPSKFWEFEQSSTNPMLFPQPVRAHRPDFSHSLDLKLLKRGIVSLKDHHPQRAADASKLSARSLAQWSQSQHDSILSDERLSQARDRESVSTTCMHAGGRGAQRSHSAPPVPSRGGLQEQKGKMPDPVDGQQQQQQQQQQQPMLTLEQRLDSKLSLSDKISRWSTATLTDYFSGREAPAPGQQSGLHVTESRETAFSPHSSGSASTMSIGTAAPLNKGGKKKIFNNTDKGRGTLRKQFEQSRPAPFATDY
jgi:hypothetical protein